MQFLKSLEQKVRVLRNKLSPWIYRGDRFFCPVCEHSFSKLLAAGKGAKKRANAVCPFCRARERDRLSLLFLKARPELLSAPGMKLLHVAPEPCLQPMFEKTLREGYLSADLIRKDVMVRMDVTAINYADESFDAIYCSHVLQDVSDDRKALSELYRVLKKGAWAIINVPVGAELTQENHQPEIIKAKWDSRPHERLRIYGKDFDQRLAAAGFEVDCYDPPSVVPDKNERDRMAVDTPDAGSVYFVTRPRCWETD